MNIIFILIILFVVSFLYIRYLERTTVFFPDRNIEQDPGSVGLKYEQLSITTSDGEVLYGWWIPKEEAKFTVLFFHGNAGNVSHRIGKISFLHQLGFNVLIVDYRGYGKSTGSPTEKGVYLDAQATWEYAVHQKNIPPQEIIAYGGSLGGAIAIDLASKKEVRAVIIDSTFSSAKDMAKLMFPLAPTFFMTVEFHSIQKIKQIKAPKLLFHSTDDETVPFVLGQKLFDAAHEPKTFVTTVGGHNDEDVLSRELFESSIKAFVHSLEASHE